MKRSKWKREKLWLATLEWGGSIGSIFLVLLIVIAIAMAIL